MRAVETTPTDLPASDIISAKVVRRLPSSEVQSSWIPPSGSRLMVLKTCLTPVFIAPAVGAESGVWALTL